MVARRVEEIRARNRARAAKGGGDTTDQSVTAVDKDILENMSIDQLMIMAGAQERSRQLKREADQVRKTGDIRYRQERNSALAGAIGGAVKIGQGIGEWSQKYGGS